jgi:hypothetical protein
MQTPSVSVVDFIFTKIDGGVVRGNELKYLVLLGIMVLSLFIPTIAVAPATSGIWISRTEIMSLPMTGSAWQNVKKQADSNWGSPNLSDLNSKHDVLALAGALVYARTGQESYRVKTANAIMSAIGTEKNSRGLEVSRNITAYVIAADIIDFRSYDSVRENTFRSWLTALRTQKMTDGKTIISTHEGRPNNWGTHAGAARIAIDLYINDRVDLEKAARVFKGWLGDRNAYASFKFNELDWQANKANPVGINSLGATINGKNVDGVLPDDQRRSGGFKWPAPKENYVWEVLQGATVQAHMLHRAGYDSWNWSNKALLRATTWLYNVDNFPAESDDTFIPWIINKAYNTSFTTKPANIGKNISYTDWTLAR